MRKLLYIPFLMLLCAIGAQAQSCVTATCPATTPGLTDFLHALPAPGNANSTVTVTLPAGTATWTGSGFVNYAVPAGVTDITVQGTTTVSCTGTPGLSNFTCSATDGTIITDGMSSNNQIVFVTNGASTRVRFTGITFVGSSSAASKFNAVIALSGSSQNVRLDHNHFNMGSYTGAAGWMRTYGAIFGVVDHNVVDQGPNLLGNWNFIQADPTNVSDLGDGAFSAATQFGTANFIYVEANQINGGYGNDCYAGGRIVMRYNTFNGMNVAIQSHDLKTAAGAWRGCRAMEFYKNYITATTQGPAMVGPTSATILAWGNTIASGVMQYGFDGSTGRALAVNGEAEVPNGWGYAGSTPVAAGTTNVSAPSGSAYTLTGTGFSTSWPSGTLLLIANPGGLSTNQYADFVISSVSSSTSMIATCNQLPNGSTCPVGALTGVAYAVGTLWDGNHNSNGYPALDMLGRGQTLQALNGLNFPNRLNSTTGTVAWPQQYLEPIYQFMNAYGGATPVRIGDAISTQNIDVFAENGSCGGSGCSSLATGTGYGTLAQRPTTCTAGPGGTFYTSPTGSYGVAYWATDANSGNGELYVCTSANTWTPIYQPYTYPHPLTSSGGTPQVVDPSCSPSFGLPPQTVTCSDLTSGAIICFRVDGVAPTAPTPGTCGASTTQYSGPISITVNPTALKIIATLSGDLNSNVVTYNFTGGSGKSGIGSGSSFGSGTEITEQYDPLKGLPSMFGR